MAEKHGSLFNEYLAYSRATQLLMDCGIKVFRRLFKDYVSRGKRTLGTFLADQKNILLAGFTGIINECVLFPKDGVQTNLELWDVSLLVYVISKTCPEIKDIVADVGNIRTKICHSSYGAQLSKEMFDSFWVETEEILQKALALINNRQFSKEIQSDIEKIKEDKNIQNPAHHQRLLLQWNQLETHLADKIEAATIGRYMKM